MGIYCQLVDWAKAGSIVMKISAAVIRTRSGNERRLYEGTARRYILPTEEHV